MSTDESWVFDSLVCFLHGPVWNAPLQTFIEEKSLIFDPNLQLDENSPDIKQIHDDYKNLVDYMLGSFMEEMQITPEQFEMACMEGKQHHKDNPFQFHQGLFQQIWAANDIKIFIRMMTQRNVELQLQALDLIEKNQLALLQEQDGSFDSPTDSLHSQSDKLSGVEDLIAKSVEIETETPEASVTPEHDESEQDVTDKFERLNLFFEKNQQVNPDEMLTRQEYLRQQRDKIIEIKKKTRAKQLQETVAKTMTTSGTSTPNSGRRPTSAQVAQQLMENVSQSVLGFDKVEESETNSALQLRKTLAKRLKAEVVEQN